MICFCGIDSIQFHLKCFFKEIFLSPEHDRVVTIKSGCYNLPGVVIWQHIHQSTLLTEKRVDKIPPGIYSWQP